MTEDFKDLIGKKSPDSDSNLDSNLSSREMDILSDLDSGKHKDKEHERRGKNKGKDKKQIKQKGFIRKYTRNGTLSLHESTIVSGQSIFLCLTDSHKPQYVPDIETGNKLLYPGDTIDTQNPLPYIFKSVAELEESF